MTLIEELALIPRSIKKDGELVKGKDDLTGFKSFDELFGNH